MADPNTVTRGEGVRRWLINVAFTVDLIIFGHQTKDQRDKIMFLISMNNTCSNNITFISIMSQKAKFMHAKVGHTFLSPFLNSPTICGDAATQSSVVYIITNRLTVISLSLIESKLRFLLHIISYVCVFE